MPNSLNCYFKKQNYIFFLLLIFSFSIKAQKSMPKRDLVPDKETAIKIAKAIWLPIFGERINKFSEFRTELTKDNIWIVNGIRVPLTKGGYPVIYIRKKDCKILDVYYDGK